MSNKTKHFSLVSALICRGKRMALKKTFGGYLFMFKEIIVSLIGNLLLESLPVLASNPALLLIVGLLFYIIYQLNSIQKER